jgi:hypothetical protein
VYPSLQGRTEEEMARGREASYQVYPLRRGRTVGEMVRVRGVSCQEYPSRRDHREEEKDHELRIG